MPLDYCTGCPNLQPAGYCIIMGWVEYMDGDQKPSKINPCRWK